MEFAGELTVILPCASIPVQPKLQTCCHTHSYQVHKPGMSEHGMLRWLASLKLAAVNVIVWQPMQITMTMCAWPGLHQQRSDQDRLQPCAGHEVGMLLSPHVWDWHGK